MPKGWESGGGEEWNKVKGKAARRVRVKDGSYYGGCFLRSGVAMFG